MKKQHIFDSKINEIGKFAESITNDEIKHENMFFNSSLDFALEKGGKITQSFIKNLPEEWKDGNTVFDSRVHMLMPGWYPAIPGYHHDDVPRPDIPAGQHFITAGQPDYDNPRYHSNHILGLVNADICPTQFILGKCPMSIVPDGELIYRKWDAEIKAMLEEGLIEKVSCKDRTLIEFDCNAFHSGTKTVKNGWRWFGRVSRNTDRIKKITNEIRVNAQVYLEFPMEGW